MREIKFRAWDKDNNCMIENWYEITEEKFTKDRFLGRQAQTLVTEVMQFTGLKDKNGKEIFEGDIIKVHDLEEDEEIRDEDFIGVFIYDKENLRFQFDEKYLGYIDEIGFIVTSDWLDYEYEVIGNIHENKELLEVKE